MFKIMPLLLCDFYKTVHSEQYPKDVTKIVSYFTPRMTRLKNQNKLIMFGLQGFIKEYLIEYFNQYFFGLPEDDVLKQYNRILEHTLGKGIYKDRKIRELHQLGYLPIQIKAISEGNRVDIKVPMFEVSNTHPEFAWVVNALETLISCNLWHPMISANVGYEYRKLVNKYYDLSVEDSVPRARALGDFAMRGQESTESAVRSSVAWLLSFLNTATVPAIPYLEQYYNCDCEKEPVGFGSPSTEHSVMCSNFAIDGDEITMIKRLLTEIYPNTNFSVVSDSYDYWNMVTKIIPACRKEIMEHKGTMMVRGDSGCPVDIICGTKIFKEFESEEDWTLSFGEHRTSIEAYGSARFYSHSEKCGKAIDAHAKIKDKYFSKKIYTYYVDRSLWHYYEKAVEFTPTPEELGTVWCLWNEFGGTINSKGYKVLDSHIKAIYGDSITPQRAEKIFTNLTKMGFACNNVALGVGSFSMQCSQEEDGLSPFTRDTFGIAIKATYCETKDGKKINIFKDPKTDTGNFKKSQKGCCVVKKDMNGDFTYEDEKTFTETLVESNELKTVFENGKMVKEYSLSEIRNTLHNNKF